MKVINYDTSVHGSDDFEIRISTNDYGYYKEILRVLDACTNDSSPSGNKSFCEMLKSRKSVESTMPEIDTSHCADKDNPYPWCGRI
jgi:hypothetical protein